MFWNIFYNLCTERETSPNAVCKAIGLSNSMATYWKNGTMPKGDVLIQIADYFNVSTDYLLGRTNNPTSSSDTYTFGDNNGIQAVNNSSVSVGMSTASNQSEKIVEEFMKRFAELNLDDKIEVMNFTLQKAKKGA